MILDSFFEYSGDSVSRETRQTANEAKQAASDVERKMNILELKVERSLMVCEALWEIVKKSHKLNDEDLKELIREIDLKDGNLNGKVNKTAPSKCATCGKTIQRNHIRCMYCGAEADESVFKR